MSGVRFKWWLGGLSLTQEYPPYDFRMITEDCCCCINNYTLGFDHKNFSYHAGALTSYPDPEPLAPATPWSFEQTDGELSITEIPETNSECGGSGNDGQWAHAYVTFDLCEPKSIYLDFEGAMPCNACYEYISFTFIFIDDWDVYPRYFYVQPPGYLDEFTGWAANSWTLFDADENIYYANSKVTADSFSIREDCAAMNNRRIPDQLHAGQYDLVTTPGGIYIKLEQNVDPRNEIDNYITVQNHTEEDPESGCAGVNVTTGNVWFIKQGYTCSANPDSFDSRPQLIEIPLPKGISTLTFRPFGFTQRFSSENHYSKMTLTWEGDIEYVH